MRVDFCNENDEVIGQAFLDDDGTIRTEGYASKIDDVFVAGPDGEKTPADGAAYLEALPFAFRSPYLRACLVR
jgi:hypothetical protein